MGRDVEVNQPTRGMLHYHKHVEDSERGGHHDAGITGDNQPSVIPEKDCPPLIAPRSAERRGRQLRHVLPDCARRHAHTELQQQLVCDPLLAPRGVLARHLSNQMLERGWDRSPASAYLTTVAGQPYRIPQNPHSGADLPPMATMAGNS